MAVYSYNGPVEIYGKCVINYWKACTTANSEKQAKNNLAYRYKEDCKLPKFCKVNLPGKIENIG